MADILLAAKSYVNLMDIYQTCQENPQKKIAGFVLSDVHWKLRCENKWIRQ